MKIEISAREAKASEKVLRVLGPVGEKLDDFVSNKILEAKVLKNEDGSMTFEISSERTNYLVRKFFEIGVGIAPHTRKIAENIDAIKRSLSYGTLGREIKRAALIMRERYASPHAYSIRLHMQDEATELVLVDTDIDRQSKTIVGETVKFGAVSSARKKAVENLGTFRSLQEAEERFFEISVFAKNYAKAHGELYVGDVILAMYGD